MTRRSRYGNRTDANQADIIEELERLPGCQVIDLSAVGSDVPDLLVGFRRQWVLMEVKTANGELSPGQEEFKRDARGPVVVVRSPVEAVDALIRATADYPKYYQRKLDRLATAAFHLGQKCKVAEAREAALREYFKL